MKTVFVTKLGLRDALVGMGYVVVDKVLEADFAICSMEGEEIEARTLGVRFMRYKGLWPTIWEFLAQEIIYGTDLCSGVGDKAARGN